MEAMETGISPYAYALVQYGLGRMSVPELRFLAHFWLTPAEAEDIIRLLRPADNVRRKAEESR